MIDISGSPCIQDTPLSFRLKILFYQLGAESPIKEMSNDFKVSVIIEDKKFLTNVELKDAD